MRESLYDLPSTDNPVEQAVRAGDLFPKAGGTIGNAVLLTRACFLQDRDLILHFSSVNESNFDFWYAIGTGILKVQDRAIQRAIEDPSSISHRLDSIEDEATIPWTSKLRTKLRTMVEGLPVEKIPPRIFGMLRMKLSEEVNLRTAVIEYLIARIRSLLNYGTTYLRNLEVESILVWRPLYWEQSEWLFESQMYMKMGYFMPIISKIRMERELSLRTCATALSLVNYDLLQIMVDLGYSAHVKEIEAHLSYGLSISIRMAEKARRCLSSQKIVNMMSSATVERYRIVAGDVFHSINPLRQFVGPTPRLLPHGGRDVLTSTQGIVIYDLSGMGGNAAERYAFSRGNSDRQRPPKMERP